jgi:uncharacterized protein YdcH (DUF465 family)
MRHHSDPILMEVSMKMSGAWVFWTIVICVMFFGQLSLAQETVYRATVSTSPPPDPNRGPFVKTFTNQQVVSLTYQQEGTILPCKYGDAVNFNADKCISVLADKSNSFKVYTNSFQVYTTDEIDGKFNELGDKVNSLNKRMADDEAGLPAAVDQYAVQKLLDKINSLEARVKTLESQASAHQQ